MSSLFSHLSNFKTTESLDLHLHRNTIEKQFSHIAKCHLLQKVFKHQVLWSSHQFINKGWRRIYLVMKTFKETILVDATWITYNSLQFPLCYFLMFFPLCCNIISLTLYWTSIMISIPLCYNIMIKIFINFNIISIKLWHTLLESVMLHCNFHCTVIISIMLHYNVIFTQISIAFHKVISILILFPL